MKTNLELARIEAIRKMSATLGHGMSVVDTEFLTAVSNQLVDGIDLTDAQEHALATMFEELESKMP